ncbi:DJ-1/PfpI family protein [Agrobacterium vitis]|uniref:DJ-1/PfpI family protein n=1 Tax=Agrobacterium vitis TaxID=373 RepID=A0A368NWI3_AGRVI|nr:DJ-1/PfpI family protein [Agrobacterium vitis]KAA3506350.1 DJ-1/PfpI family protein [Agrobacterium vitis]KAA3520749.1 DJ-1/PfpI family protein [Agrobacterium vitis]MCF1476178.1 DJ-1/PfpI family protein [Agrobacterium vitis]MUZ98500.1 DJ-1/PfpI family protein [Agrobacterium vitis]MVA31195.1 DJ-1/PfpI family protein [Agrobacterium vitis]
MTFHVGILVFPNVQQLDLTGPFEVFASAPDVVVHLIWKDLAQIMSATGLSLSPTVTFTDCPPLDVICVPGGKGIDALMEDEDVLTFLREKALDAAFVTSVCTGSLVLAAAGLLKDKKATSHWASKHLLAPLGAIPTQGRIVTDGNVITAGGVTAGIDFGLTVLAALIGEDVAQTVQLALEYAPDPPFQAGTPETAPAAIVARVRENLAATLKQRQDIVQRMTAS